MWKVTINLNTYSFHDGVEAIRFAKYWKADFLGCSGIKVGDVVKAFRTVFGNGGVYEGDHGCSMGTGY